LFKKQSYGLEFIPDLTSSSAMADRPCNVCSRRYKQKSVEVGVLKKGVSLWAQISDGRGHRPPTTIGV